MIKIFFVPRLPFIAVLSAVVLSGCATLHVDPLEDSTSKSSLSLPLTASVNMETIGTVDGAGGKTTAMIPYFFEKQKARDAAQIADILRESGLFASLVQGTGDLALNFDVRSAFHADPGCADTTFLAYWIPPMLGTPLWGWAIKCAASAEYTGHLTVVDSENRPLKIYSATAKETVSGGYRSGNAFFWGGMGDLPAAHYLVEMDKAAVSKLMTEFLKDLEHDGKTLLASAKKAN